MPAGIANTLRERTRAEHDRIEEALDWQSRAADRQSYADWLERLQGFYSGWEPALAEAVDDPLFFDERRKLPLLERDLAALGRPVGPGHEAPLYPFTTQAEALGALYVLEGSTLGGLLIAAHVRGHLGFEPAFHGGYGKQTAQRWQSFRARLDHAIGADELDASVAAARRTFTTLGEQLTA